MKNILYRITAFWALITFTVTITIVALLLFLTSWLREPRKTEVFRRISMVWIRFYYLITGCGFVIKGREHFKKGKVYIVTCNHNSFIDVPTLTPFVPGPNKTIAKAEMARIPIFGLVYKRGSILVNRKDKDSRKASYLQMVQVLKKGMHMCIYPEGTRNKTAAPLKEFYDGAFRLAVDTQHDIIPALIFNTKKVLPTDKTFYFRPSRIELHFLEPVPVAGFTSATELKEHVHNVMTGYYEANRS